MILGLSLMSAGDILDTIHTFSNMDFEIMSMTPDINGKASQVITIDLDYDKSYLLANSIDEFYSFILRMFDAKKLFTEADEDGELYFEFESGHFFNNLDDILSESEDNLEEIQLVDEFWKRYYNDVLKENKVSIGILKKRRGFLLRMKNFHLNLLCI